jgi:hypothetical protein
VVVRLLGADPDPGSGLQSILYTIDGGQPLPSPPDGFLALDGDHTYEYWSVDNAGNVGATGTARIVVVGRPETVLALFVGALLLGIRHGRTGENGGSQGR